MHPTSAALALRYPESKITAEQFDKAFQELSAEGHTNSLRVELVCVRIENLVVKFADEGLTVKEYLSAAVKQPQLFCQTPETVEKNIRGLVVKFASEGLTVKEYLSAAVEKPSLFCQVPETVEKNIRGLVGKFASEGLTVKEYLSAAVKQPQLFYQTPETIEKNIRGLVGKFASEGLTVKEYLSAAVEKPSLFCQTPETVGGHIRLLKKLGELDILHFGKENSQTDFWKAILNNPARICFSNENYLWKGVFSIEFDKKQQAFGTTLGAIKRELLALKTGYEELLDSSFVGHCRQLDQFLGTRPRVSAKLAPVLALYRELETDKKSRSPKKKRSKAPIPEAALA